VSDDSLRSLRSVTFRDDPGQSRTFSLHGCELSWLEDQLIVSSISFAKQSVAVEFGRVRACLRRRAAERALQAPIDALKLVSASAETINQIFIYESQQNS